MKTLRVTSLGWSCSEAQSARTAIKSAFPSDKWSSDDPNQFLCLCTLSLVRLSVTPHECQFLMTFWANRPYWAYEDRDRARERKNIAAFIGSWCENYGGKIDARSAREESTFVSVTGKIRGKHIDPWEMTDMGLSAIEQLRVNDLAFINEMVYSDKEYAGSKKPHGMTVADCLRVQKLAPFVQKILTCTKE